MQGAHGVCALRALVIILSTGRILNVYQSIANSHPRYHHHTTWEVAHLYNTKVWGSKMHYSQVTIHKIYFTLNHEWTSSLAIVEVTLKASNLLNPSSFHTKFYSWTATKSGLSSVGLLRKIWLLEGLKPRNSYIHYTCIGYTVSTSKW